jgi:drug efflux transport system permease protein
MSWFSMIRFRQMVKKETKQLLRDPKAKPLLLVSPIVQFILLAYATTTDVEHIRTVIVDQDRSADSRALVDAYTATGYFEIIDNTFRIEQIPEALDRGDAMVGIVIPPGLSADLRSGRGARIQALIDGSDASVATVAQSYVGQVASSFGIKTMGTTRPAAGAELRARAWFNPSLESRLFNVPAIMGTLMLTTCLMLTTMTLVREREIGTLDQLLVSPVNSLEIMLGKMTPVMGVGIFHLGIFVSLTLFHFGVPFRGSVVSVALASFLYLLASMAIGLLISAVSTTQQEAFMLMILVMLPTIIMSGFLSPIETMPQAFQWLTQINPVRHYLDIVRGVFLKGTGLVELWPQFAALALTSVGGLLLAGNRFRRTIA